MPHRYVLKCRNCGDSGDEPSVVLIVAWYFIHVVKNHWEYVEELRDTDDAVIAAAYKKATDEGWLRDIYE